MDNDKTMAPWIKDLIHILHSQTKEQIELLDELFRSLVEDRECLEQYKEDILHPDDG